MEREIKRCRSTTIRLRPGRALTRQMVLSEVCSWLNTAEAPTNRVTIPTMVAKAPESPPWVEALCTMASMPRAPSSPSSPRSDP